MDDLKIESVEFIEIFFRGSNSKSSVFPTRHSKKSRQPDGTGIRMRRMPEVVNGSQSELLQKDMS